MLKGQKQQKGSQHHKIDREREQQILQEGSEASLYTTSSLSQKEIATI